MLRHREDADTASRTAGRVLDDYVEAQVHGPVTLARDVRELVVDPSFRGRRRPVRVPAAVARRFRAAGAPGRRRLPWALWHPVRPLRDRRVTGSGRCVTARHVDAGRSTNRSSPP
ncbi:DUF3626 domain-containing protein [Micromonospora craniellae]|uniref:DUF3626 domain-containing protein n=1 Tax=Micromonospora craniellae TaxID=2294034 RepID=UPI0037C6A130